MKKKNGLTENQKKFKDEYYKNPYICMELYNNLININPSFLGYSNETESGFPKPPEYLAEYQRNFNYYDKLYLTHKYTNLVVNWLLCKDAKQTTYTKTPEYISGEIEFNWQYWYELCRSVIATNDYKYSKIYSTIILEYGILDNLDITREETVTESYGAQRNFRRICTQYDQPSEYPFVKKEVFCKK